MPSTFDVFALCLIPVAATAIGATLGVLGAAGDQFKSAIQHFAAGVIFAVVGVELLPPVIAVHDPLEVGLTFGAGLGLMLMIKLVPKQLASRASNIATPNSTTLSQAVAIGIDIAIDGLLIGIALAAGARSGFLLTAALSLELLSIGVALTLSMRSDGRRRIVAVAVPVGLSILLFVGAGIGQVALNDASPHTLAGVLSFGSAALLYLVTEELLTEAHEVADTTFATAMFFAGFLLFLLLGMVK